MTPHYRSICSYFSFESSCLDLCDRCVLFLLCRAWFLSEKVVPIKGKQQQPSSRYHFMWLFIWAWVCFLSDILISVSDIGSLSGRLFFVWKTPEFYLSGCPSIWHTWVLWCPMNVINIIWGKCIICIYK